MPNLLRIPIAFISGIACLIILNRLLNLFMKALWKKGDIQEPQLDKTIGLSPFFAGIEQTLFFIAALAGRDIFGFSVGGWLVFKGIHQWSRWHLSVSVNSQQLPEEETSRAKDLGLTPELYREARDRNRFMVFVAGTGMSIAVGGISGATFYYVMLLLETYC